MFKCSIIRSIFLLALLFFGIRLYCRLTDDFRLANMTYDLPYNVEWETPPQSLQEKNKLLAILDQPYYYLGKGAQSYAFLSKDKKYVVKFFKFKHLKPSWIVSHLPDIPPFYDYKTKKIARKKRLIQSVFDGYKLAYTVHKDESALEYIHLNKTDELHLEMTLYDKIGLKRTIDLDDTIFVVQKFTTTTREVLKQALNAGNVTQAKELIDSIIDLYLQEYKKGIYDRDHGLTHNTGFIDNTPIHLDVGKMTKNAAISKVENFKPDLIQVCNRLRTWLKNNYPEYYSKLNDYLQNRLSGIFKENFEFASP